MENERDEPTEETPKEAAKTQPARSKEEMDALIDRTIQRHRGVYEKLAKR